MGGDQAAQAVAGRYGPARFLPLRFPIRHVPDSLPDRHPHRRPHHPKYLAILRPSICWPSTEKRGSANNAPGQPGLHGDLPGLQFPQQQLFGSRQLNPIDFDKDRMIG